jgi:flavin reductase (DIM6/NTAB) family NADH-FMN oxidoreductase RutF
MPIERSKFRETAGMVPTGVAVVTLPPAACPHGVTVNSFDMVSLSPPLVSIALDSGSKAHELLQQTSIDGFCLNVLTADQRRLGRYFADLCDLDENPFVSEPVRTEATDAPVFEDSLAYIDCTVHDSYETGDHTIYVGHVQSADVMNRRATPLTHFRSNWHAAPD